jgi:hypothetical protein
MGKEFTARLLLAQMGHGPRDITGRNFFQIVQPPARLDVGHGLDVEYQHVHSKGNAVGMKKTIGF